VKRKSREEVLLDRLRSKGLESDPQQKGAPFTFVVSPTICTGIDSTDVRRLALAFKREVFNRIRAEKLETTLAGVVIFPRILDPKLARGADKLTYKRKDIHILNAKRFV
jgi:hypothetical protein